ncbi:hypothetical protein JOE25_002898 [Serratia sp. PL17]|uniref:hypothetical protein n=1 Tax=Serratia sp. PL17 TaxID=2806582 RepID=UPI001AE9E28F|nr:hypothetical protein [Serratia sp. PL17]MBP1131318.1 hypothetical protein [Serratia sp. PL17]
MTRASTEDLRIFLMEVTDEIGSAHPETRDTKISARLLRDILTELLANREAQPVAGELGEICVGRLPTMNQEEYPGLGDWWVQLRIGANHDEILARVYGATPEEAVTRARALTAPPAPAVVNLPTEFYSDEGIVIQLEKVMAALAIVGVRFKRNVDACRAAMLAQPVSQYFKSQTSINTNDDRAMRLPESPEGGNG